MNSLASLALAAITALVLTSAVRAGESTYLSPKVTYADLDLNTLAGDAELYRRVRLAAARVCWDFEGHRLLGRFLAGPSGAACETDVLQQTVRRIHVRRFTDYVTRQNELLSAGLAAP